jgi:hypothetical protein
MEKTHGQQNYSICYLYGTGKSQIKATTNQTIKAYEAMNNRLHFENETIKACCDSQAIQQAIMQQQITELLA